MQRFFNPIALTPDLFVGPGPGSIEEAQRLRSLGIDRLLSLQTDADLAARGLRWPVLWQMLLSQGIRAERHPIVDFDAKDFARQLGDAVTALEELLAVDDPARPPRVYVHCTAGINRSPSLALAVLARRMGFEAALALLGSAHPGAVPYEAVIAKWLKRNH
jgi:hypothetical protein